MRTNQSQLIKNEITIRSANSINTKPITRSVRCSYDRRRKKIPALLSQADVSELRELIGTIGLAGYSPSPEVDQIITCANRPGSDFTARLAVRALRLEQTLNVAQERIIRLEWNLAQANKYGRSG